VSILDPSREIRISSVYTSTAKIPSTENSVRPNSKRFVHLFRALIQSDPGDEQTIGTPICLMSQSSYVGHLFKSYSSLCSRILSNPIVLQNLLLCIPGTSPHLR
jgi:hypothetical protein